MSDILYSKQHATTDELAGLIATCDFSSEALMLLERLPARVLDKPGEREQLLLFEHFNLKANFREYTSGRVFCEESELRWEKQGELFSVVYLGSAANSATLQRHELQDRTKVVEQLDSISKPNYYALFGERLEQEELQYIKKGAQPGEYFAEARIPRLLRYPVEQGQQPYVRLKVLEYFDKMGQVVFYRFQGLEPYGRRHESI